MRLLLALLLLTLTAPAWAEWVKYEEHDDIVFYYDPATIIKKRGNFRRVWLIQDLKQRDDGVRSRRSMLEFDCNEQRNRRLSFSAHSERMASGKTIGTDSKTGGWDYIAPGTVAAGMLQIVCQ